MVPTQFRRKAGHSAGVLTSAGAQAYVTRGKRGFNPRESQTAFPTTPRIQRLERARTPSIIPLVAKKQAPCCRRIRRHAPFYVIPLVYTFAACLDRSRAAPPSCDLFERLCNIHRENGGQIVIYPSRQCRVPSLPPPSLRACAFLICNPRFSHWLIWRPLLVSSSPSSA